MKKISQDQLKELIREEAIRQMRVMDLKERKSNIKEQLNEMGYGHYEEDEETYEEGGNTYEEDEGTYEEGERTYEEAEQMEEVGGAGVPDASDYQKAIAVAVSDVQPKKKSGEQQQLEEISLGPVVNKMAKFFNNLFSKSKDKLVAVAKKDPKSIEPLKRYQGRDFLSTFRNIYNALKPKEAISESEIIDEGIKETLSKKLGQLGLGSGIIGLITTLIGGGIHILADYGQVMGISGDNIAAIGAALIGASLLAYLGQAFLTPDEK